MKQLVSNQTCGIIATHDLALGELEKEFPAQIKNYRFEADIKNEELTFSYQLREGVAQNMNACFLMKKWGSPCNPHSFYLNFNFFYFFVRYFSISGRYLLISFIRVASLG